MAELKVLKREFGEYKEGKFAMTEQMERTYDYNVSESITKLKQIKAEIETIPVKIKTMEEDKEKYIKFYNEGLDVLKEADKKYKLELDFEELKLV